MSKKIIPSIIFVILAFVLVGFITILFNSRVSQIDTKTSTTSANNSTSANSSSNVVKSKPVTTSSSGTYTIAQIATHNNNSSCWSVVNGSVYDLTSWINQHPGGAEAILSMCGKDGSADFNDQHGGQRRPANELAGFKIGSLIQ